MTSIITTVHGFDFVIDTADWSDEESRQVAEDVIESELRNLTPEQAAQLHAELRAFDDGDRDTLPEIARAISRKAFAVATADWATKPTSGHNVEIGAE